MGCTVGHGWPGDHTKTKPTIYNYDRMLLKPRWDWMTGKKFLPKKKQETDKKQSGSRSNWRSGNCGGPGRFTWVSHGFHYVVLPTSSNMGFKRSWKTSENMRKDGRHGHLLNLYWLQTHSGKKNHHVRWCGQSFFAMPSNTWQILSKDPWKLRSLHSIHTRYSD